MNDIKIRNPLTLCEAHKEGLEFVRRNQKQIITAINKDRFGQFMFDSSFHYCEHVYVKAIPVTGHGGPTIYEKLRILHFPNNRLTDGGEDVSLARWQATLYPQE
jgi:hypothetical protein